MNAAPSAYMFYGANLVVVTALVSGAILFFRRRTPLSRASSAVRASGVAFLLLCALTHVELAFHAAVNLHIINDDGSVSPHMWLLYIAKAISAWTFLFAGAAAASRHYPSPERSPAEPEPDT